MLSRAILNGALCLDGIGFPDDDDRASRMLDSRPPMLRLHKSAESWHQDPYLKVTGLDELSGDLAESIPIGNG